MIAHQLSVLYNVCVEFSRGYSNEYINITFFTGKVSAAGGHFSAGGYNCTVLQSVLENPDCLMTSE